MIAKTLLLLLSAQLGLAKLDFPINRLVISDPPSVGSTSWSAGSGEGGHGPSEGLNLGAIDTDVDELELVLTDQKIWFTINVTFGNGLEGEDEDSRAARTHTLVLDSGSQDLWIMESGCTSQNCGWNETFGPPAGYTHLPSGENNFIPWKREYYGTASAGQTNVSGFDVNDTISLGGPEDAVDMTFSVANIVQGLPVGNTFQGIFPIGPARYGITNDSSADSDPRKGPLRMLRKAGVISNEDIGFSLSPAKPSLTIGGQGMAQGQQGGMGVPAAGGQMFTPGLAGQQPAAAVQGGGGGYFAPAGQVPGVGAGAPVGGGYGQQDVLQQQQGYAGQPMVPGMQGLTDGFRGMGMGEKLHPLQTVNLIGLQPDVREIDTAPPPILLPPGACISPHATAQADPSYQRSTINAIPTTASLLNKSKIPLALILTPYRSLKPGDEPVPVVNDTVIARCRRCRSYINPYVTFIEGGARWKCCMCNLSNEVPQLFDWNAQTNQPADRWSRAELNHGVVEFVAPAEYMIRAPQPPVYVFIIDVSQNAIQSGMVATAARTILESLDRLPNADDRTKIGFIAVSSSLHFFSLPPGQAEPTMLVVSDVEDVYLPKPTDLLVNLTESRPVIESFLTRLSDMFKDSFTSASAVGPAMQAAHKLIGTIGGKIITLTATLPTVGEGALKARDDAKLLGTAKEATLLQAASSFYKTFSIDCARNQVTVDMFLFSPQYTDVASLRCLPRYTGGQVYYYPGFNAGRSEDAIKFATEFGTVLASPIGLEAVIRVRGSRGLRMSAFHGNFFTRSTDLLSLPTVPIDQSYAIELQIEDPLTQPVVVLQTAVLHTTCYGERRIRVMTTALPTTTSMSEIFASADQNAILTLLANKAVERAMSSKLEDARDAVVNKLVDILKVYKDTMTSAGGGASAQLAIPENLKLLPLLCCGLVKHVGLRESTQIPPDLRAYAHALLTTLPTQSLLAYLHPRFYSLHNMPADAGTIGPDGVILPPALNLTSERLERHGLYLIDDGQNIFLYVGQDAVPQLVMDVFGLPSYQELKGGKYTLPVLDNPFSQRVNAIIGKTREMRRNPYWQHLYVVKADAEPTLRNWALSMLIEDRVDRSASYGQFLSLIKDKVNGS